MILPFIAIHVVWSTNLLRKEEVAHRRVTSYNGLKAIDVAFVAAADHLCTSHSVHSLNIFGQQSI